MCSIRLCRESLTDARRAERNRARKSFFFSFFLLNMKERQGGTTLGLWTAIQRAKSAVYLRPQRSFFGGLGRQVCDEAGEASVGR